MNAHPSAGPRRVARREDAVLRTQMSRSWKLAPALFASVLYLMPGFAQAPAAPKTIDKAGAYYNFAMGHLYAELAGAYGNRGDYVNKAIDHYKQALKLDPDAEFLLEELTELYVQSNQLRSAVTEAEEAIKANPNHIAARRMLARIYTRLIGDAQQGRVNEEMLKRAIEQYQILTEKEPKDAENWVTLGRLQRVSQNSVQAQKAFEKAIELEADNEDALTGLAMVYSDLGDTKNMVDMLRRVADKNPSLRTLTALANAYEQMRDYAGAAENFRRALALSRDNLQLKRALAQNLLYSDQIDEALKIYLEIAEDEPKDAQTQLRLSEIYRSKQDFTKAREANARAKQLDKNSIESRFDEVSLLDAEGKSDEAIAAMRRLMDETAKASYSKEEKASRAMLLERLGGLYRSNHKYIEAVGVFREIAALAPEVASRAAVQVIETYRIAKDFTKAMEEAAATRAKFPDDRTVKVVYASLLADTGKAQQGADEIRSLLNTTKDRETYLTLAQILEKGKNYPAMEEALKEAEKLSDSKQEVEAISFMRGAMFEKMKKFDAAETEFRKVIADNPRNAGALNYLGYMLADRNVRLDEAYTLISKAIELDPNNGAYLDSLGWVYFRQGKLDQAETYLRRSLDRTAGDPTVHDHLGDVYIKQGKLKDAIAQWEMSLREWQSSSKADHDVNEVAKVTKKLDAARVRLAREGSTARP